MAQNVAAKRAWEPRKLVPRGSHHPCTPPPVDLAANDAAIMTALTVTSPRVTSRAVQLHRRVLYIQRCTYSTGRAVFYGRRRNADRDTAHCHIERCHASTDATRRGERRASRSLCLTSPGFVGRTLLPFSHTLSSHSPLFSHTRTQRPARPLGSADRRPLRFAEGASNASFTSYGQVSSSSPLRSLLSLL